MTCPACKRTMSALFLSTACDYCDFGVPKERLHKGYVVYGPGSAFTEEYVFKTHADAERWREMAGRQCCAIRAVYSLTPYRWHLSRGSMRDVMLADHMFEIFKDHRFEPKPNRAFLEVSDV
jgi:hypothetical protein